MATINQKNAFKKTVERIKDNKRVVMGEVMRDVGYSNETALKPKLLTSSKGWQDLMAQIDDATLLQRLYDIALDKNDKRATLQAVDMLLKLKDKYPDSKLRLGAIEQRHAFMEVIEDNNKEATLIQNHADSSISNKR